MVGLPLGGARWVRRRRRRRTLSLHLPEWLEGRMVQTLLRQIALGGIKQQQVLTEERFNRCVLWRMDENLVAEINLKRI